MPNTPEATLILFGCLLITGAVLGGGFKLSGIEVPGINWVRCALSGIIGLVLLSLGMGIVEANRSLPTRAVSNTTPAISSSGDIAIMVTSTSVPVEPKLATVAKTIAPSPSKSAPATVTAILDLDQALLRLTDLSADWDHGDDPGLMALEMEDVCNIDIGLQSMQSTRATFDQSNRRAIWHNLTQFHSGQAMNYLEEVSKSVSQCQPWVEIVNGMQVTFSISLLPFRSTGDQVVAWRVNGAVGNDRVLQIDYVGIRRGEVVSEIVQVARASGARTDSRLNDALVGIADNRLRLMIAGR
jgi:hypothetical protein